MAMVDMNIEQDIEMSRIFDKFSSRMSRAKLLQYTCVTDEGLVTGNRINVTIFNLILA